MLAHSGLTAQPMCRVVLSRRAWEPTEVAEQVLLCLHSCLKKSSFFMVATHLVFMFPASWVSDAVNALVERGELSSIGHVKRCC